MAGRIPPEAQLYLGRQFGSYIVRDFINEGFFGLVFEAEDITTRRTVAMKFLKFKFSSGALPEFENEDDLLFKLRRASHVVDRLDSGTDSINMQTPNGGPDFQLPVVYIVMELAEGCLEDLLMERDRLDWRERLYLFRGVVKGVHQMHLNKVVHRDLKSGNCLLMKFKGALTTKASDLGRARDLTRPPRHAALEYVAGRGDLRFAPPELLWLQGFDDPNVWRLVDTYGLGSILFELATGQGITGVALGSGPGQSINQMPPELRKAHFESEIHEIRASFEIALEMFREQFPPSIAAPVTDLLRQLCDPDPARRGPRGLGRVRKSGPGFEWLLRRIDILIRTLERAVAEEEKLRNRKARTNALRR